MLLSCWCHPRCRLQEKQPTLTHGAAPPLIYDYYGFPPESYKITYPAPGFPELAEHAAALLRYPAHLHTVFLLFDMQPIVLPPKIS